METRRETYKMRNIETWKSRYTVKQFTDKEIDLEDMEYLTDLFEYIPIQQGLLSHFWLRLGPEEQDFKTFLYEKVFHMKDKLNLHDYYRLIEQECHSAEPEKVAVVFHSDTVVEPAAVMVEAFDAFVTSMTVL